MKNKLWIVLISILILLTASSIIINKKVNSPFSVKGEYVLNVEKGDNFYKVLNKLEKEKVIFNINLIKLNAKIKKMNLTTKPGKYVIKNNTTLQEFVSMINKGNKDNLITVTIPEGYDVEQIGELLQNKGLIQKSKFIEACKEYPLPEYIKRNPKVKYSLEGYLFPDTYKFKKETSGHVVIDTMVKRFEKVLKEIQQETGMKIDDIQKEVIIASLIEKEARIDEDRTKISSVIDNRLRLGMKLQVDATVLYALGHHKEVVTIKDTKIESPYNTYYIKGLPVGPICSIGKKSFIAALKPEKTNYLFYLYKKDSTKGHYFTNNYEDFKKAMKKYGY